MMLRGVFWSLPEPFWSPPRPILRPGRFLVMWALCCFFPVAQVPHEVDGCDDGASVFLGDRAAYVPLLPSAVRSEMLPFEPPQPLCSSGPRNASMSGRSSAMRRRYSSRVTR